MSKPIEGSIHYQLIFILTIACTLILFIGVCPVCSLLQTYTISAFYVFLSALTCTAVKITGKTMRPCLYLKVNMSPGCLGRYYCYQLKSTCCSQQIISHLLVWLQVKNNNHSQPVRYLREDFVWHCSSCDHWWGIQNRTLVSVKYHGSD